MSTAIRDLPQIRNHWDGVEPLLMTRRPIVFLDFDGTLAPIVDDPSAAALPTPTRAALDRLHPRCPVVIMSGRDADDVRERVAIDGLVYAGSHGFDIIWPDGRREQRGLGHQDSLREAHERLAGDLGDVEGVEIEAKRFAVAVHHRRVPLEHLAAVTAAVDRVAAQFGDLRRTGGKQVLELRPDLDWDKGRALTWLLTELGFDGDDALPIYLGDDLTDEDAFAAVADRPEGLALVVRGEDDERPTLAGFALADVAEAGEVLARLADRLA